MKKSLAKELRALGMVPATGPKVELVRRAATELVTKTSMPELLPVAVWSWPRGKK